MSTDAGTTTTGADAGAGQQATDTAQGGAGAANTASTDAGATATTDQAATAATWNPDAWDGKVETLPAAAQKIITDLRTADGDERVAKKTLDAIVKALNPDSPEAKADPVQLAQQLTASQADGRATKVELEVYKTASEHGGNPTALTDSRTFLAKVGSLDPTAEDFRTKVIDAAKAAVAENNTLAAARAAGASGVDHAGGSGEGAITKEKFDLMSYDQQVELFTKNPTLYRQLSGG